MLSSNNITMQFGAKPLFENINVKFGGGNRLGVGLGVYDQIEKTSVFPVVIVDWRLNDRPGPL